MSYDGGGFVERFVAELMRRAFPGVLYGLHVGTLGLRFDAQHPEDGRNVSFEMRIARPLSTDDRARFARELDNRIHILLAPSQDWRTHQDYV